MVKYKTKSDVTCYKKAGFFPNRILNYQKTNLLGNSFNMLIIRNKKTRLIVCILISGIVGAGVSLLPKQNCFAAFSINVSPVDGSPYVRFGRLDTTAPEEIEEVTVTVTTDIGTQYEVVQRIDQYFISSDRREMNREQFQMYTLLNSNARGTLERLEKTPVRFTDTRLYTSNTAGTGDSFKIVYSITPQPDQTPGQYEARFIYILRAIGSAQEQVIKTVYLYAELTNEGAVEITPKRIRISSSDMNKISPRYPIINLTIKGRRGMGCRVYHQLSDFKSNAGEKFDLSKVAYELREAESDKIEKGHLSDLRPQARTLLYKFDDLDDTNTLNIRFIPEEDFPQHDAGFYKGTIDYFVEFDRTRMGGESAKESVCVEFDIEPVLNLRAVAITEEGEVKKEGGVLLEFGEVGYKTGKTEGRAGVSENIIKISITSNKKTPYSVAQSLVNPLQNEEGFKIPDEQLTFVTSRVDETRAQQEIVGKLKFEKEEAVFKSGKDMTLYVSDAQGKGAEIIVKYKLKITADQRAGKYRSEVKYTVSEL